MDTLDFPKHLPRIGVPPHVQESRVEGLSDQGGHPSNIGKDRELVA